MSDVTTTLTTWRKDIAREMSIRGESWDDVIAHSPSGTVWLDEEFDYGYGCLLYTSPSPRD